MRTLRVVRYAFLSGVHDMTALYTWKSWLLGWFLRVVAQVIFFALIGKLLGSETQTWFLLVGNATMLVAQQGVWAMNLTMWERETGTLPLLVATPTSAVVVYASRGAYLIADGTVSALGALFVTGLLFHLPTPWPRVLLVVPLLILIGATSYTFGTFLGGVVLRVREIGNLISNVTIVAMMALCGVNVRLDAYPYGVAVLAGFLPLTHGLEAVRDVFAGQLPAAGAQAGWEALVGLGWFVVCVATFARMVGHGRVDGTIEFA